MAVSLLIKNEPQNVIISSEEKEMKGDSISAHKNGFRCDENY